MSREGQTLTRTMGFETRQHELFGIDLGEGAPRRMLVWGALCCAIWWGLLYLIFGPPQPGIVFFWLAPPVFLAYYGWRDGRTRRRRKITEWVLTARWLHRGHEPVIALGRREATGAERMHLIDRIGHRFGHDDPLALVIPWRAAPERRHERPSPPARAGAPVGRTHTVQLTSTDTAAEQWQAVIGPADRRRVIRTGRHRHREAASTTSTAPAVPTTNTTERS